jgi:hypothetical protein
MVNWLASDAQRTSAIAGDLLGAGLPAGLPLAAGDPSAGADGSTLVPAAGDAVRAAVVPGLSAGDPEAPAIPPGEEPGDEPGDEPCESWKTIAPSTPATERRATTTTIIGSNVRRLAPRRAG